MADIVTDDNLSPLAAEYALGTLDPEERALARVQLDSDASFRGMVQAWERRLGELHLMVEAVEPDASIWERIKGRLKNVAAAGPGLPAAAAAAASAGAAAAVETRANGAPADRIGDKKLSDLIGAGAPFVASLDTDCVNEAHDKSDAKPGEGSAAPITAASADIKPVGEPPADEKPAESDAPQPAGVGEAADATLQPAEPAARPADQAPADQFMADIGAANDAEAQPEEASSQPAPRAGQLPDRVRALAAIARKRWRERAIKAPPRDAQVGPWRMLTLLMTLVAAALAALIAAWRYVPELLPPQLRPAEVLNLSAATGTAASKPAPPESQFDE